MKTLILLRHGKSDWKDDELVDHERPLAKRGRKAARAVGRFLRLAEQKMSVQNEKAKAELSERERAVENLVKPIRDALQTSQKQIEALEKARSEAYGSIRTQLESM